jgi:hypothetical protein
MLDNSYYYHGTIKKIVAVFGTLFNNIHTGKLIAGKLTAVTRVPLVYGPKEHWLARIRQNTVDQKETEIAVKVPRMSFEITSITYDSAAKLNRLNQEIVNVDTANGDKNYYWQTVPYIIGMQLSIYARNQDDALQIFEQIIPTFPPEYSVTVKDLAVPGTNTVVPIILTGTTFTDDYEGDYQSSRRTLIYTLDFNLKVQFAGQTNKTGIIKNIDVNFLDTTAVTRTSPLDKINITLGDPINDTPDDYTAVTTFGFL